MPWDVPDEGGSKGPEEPEDGMKTKRAYIITNLETDEKFLADVGKTRDPDSGKLNWFFKEIGRSGNN
jgi:hypothetical protein